MKRYQPTVVIGVGGTGKNILLALKKMIIENSPNGMQDYPLLRLLSLDTDISIDSVTSEIKTVKDEINLDPNTEIERLGADGLTSTLNLDQFPSIKEWYPDSKRSQLNPTMLSGGASQMKPVGRFSFAWNAAKIRDKLYNILSTTIDVDEARRNKIGESNLVPFTNVFICGSICGGTGSGIFLDVANLVRFVAKQTNVITKIYGFMALASVYDSISGDLKLKPNCYASLIELDHYQNENNFRSPKRQFYPAYRNISSSDWDYTNSSNTFSFDYPYLFDKANETGVAFSSPKQFAEMAARFIYLLTGSDVATRWESVSNNIWVNLDEDRKLHKPVRYASTGNTSIVYPRRKITQLCSFKLAENYFKIILDDSYGKVEIDRLVERFLNDSKTNPEGNESSILADSFSMFKDPDTDDFLYFTEYLDSSKGSKLDECIELIKEDKKSITGTVTNWTEDIRKIFNNFKTQTSVYPRDRKEKFISDIQHRMSEMLNLRLVEDAANPLQDGKRMTRGSVARTKAFLENLYARFTSANENFRRLEEDAREQAKDFEEIFDGKFSALKSALNSLIPSSKNIQRLLEETLSAYEDIIIAKKNEHTAKLVRQYFTEIQENGIHLSDGILKELENRILNTGSAINKFKKLQEEAKTFLYKNQTESNGNFNIEIFNYKKDVEGIYNKLMANKDFGEEQIFETLTKVLQSKEAFDTDYSRAGSALPEARIMKLLLSETEKFFFGPVAEINIRQRLLEDEEKLNALTSGAYLTTAQVYTRLDGQEMSASGLNTKGKIFYAISIPNEPEYDKYCKESLSTKVGKPFVCPFDAGGSMENSEQCPIYGKCLKAWILKNASVDLEIIPSDETGEINIMKVIVGFPLRAITSVSGPYREEYLKAMRKQKEENDFNGRTEENLHMFGTVKFADLNEAESSPLELRDSFRKALLITLIAKRLVVDSFGVHFFTGYDCENDKEVPSLDLGKNFVEATFMAESTRVNDIKAVDEIRKLAKDLQIEFVKPEYRDMFLERTREKYQEIKNLPFGFTDRDVNLLREISQECFGVDCRPDTKSKPIFK